MSIAMIGLDIAKSVLQLHGMDASGKVRLKRKPQRSELTPFFGKQQPCTVVMEACGAAHHWARVLGGLGHEVKLIAPEALLAGFARKAGAGRRRHIIPVLDDAGWHGPEGLAVPDGISLVFLPPCSPELRPAEHLWPLVDEPVANRHFATLTDLEAVIAERCRRLDAATIRPHTDLHWWPKPSRPN